MTLHTLVDWLVPGDVPSDTGSVSLVFERPLPAWAWLMVALGAVVVAVWSYRRLNRMCAVRCRDAGRNAAGRFNRDRKVGAHRCAVITHHQRQVQLLAAFARQGQTD
jgi:hypothetical protein